MGDKRELHFGYAGNGLMVWESGNNGAKGHISPERHFTLKSDSEFTEENKARIYKMISEGNMTYSNHPGEYGYLVLNPLHSPTKEYINQMTDEVYTMSVEKVDGKEYVCLDRQIFSDDPSLFDDIPSRFTNPENKKYEITQYAKDEFGTVLFRIRALKDFADVKAGDLGGYVENENNLSQEGKCWIYDKSKVSKEAHVTGNAKIINSSHVSDNAIISDSAYINRSYIMGNTKVKECARVNSSLVYGSGVIKGNSRVTANISFNGLIDDDVIISGSRVNISGNDIQIRDNARITGDVRIEDNVLVRGNALIKDRAFLSGDCNLYGNCEISDDVTINGFSVVKDNAIIKGSSKLCGNIRVCDNATIMDNAIIYDNVEISDSAVIRGNSQISGNAKVCGNAKVFGNAKVNDQALITDFSQVKGNATICDYARIGGKAIITERAKVCNNAVVGGEQIVKGNIQVNKTSQIKQVFREIDKSNDNTKE